MFIINLATLEIPSRGASIHHILAFVCLSLDNHQLPFWSLIYFCVYDPCAVSLRSRLWYLRSACVEISVFVYKYILVLFQLLHWWQRLSFAAGKVWWICVNTSHYFHLWGPATASGHHQDHSAAPGSPIWLQISEISTDCLQLWVRHIRHLEQKVGIYICKKWAYTYDTVCIYWGQRYYSACILRTEILQWMYTEDRDNWGQRYYSECILRTEILQWVYAEDRDSDTGYSDCT